MAALSTDSVRGARNDLLCNICVDIVTDIDSWITSDTTEDQIVDWLHMICEVATAILSMTLLHLIGTGEISSIRELVI